ncbi:MAG: hypothetical protein U5O39_03615 [Gammaproteobacteria bacterium]|nr:hypothetical protein [Gammaproteobacteria bacterium]
MYHELGGEDRVVYREENPSFFVGINETQSGKYLVHLGAVITSPRNPAS